VGIGTGGEVGEARGAGCDAGEHGVTVRDGFVTGEGDGALQGTGGADDLGGRCGRHYFQLKWFCVCCEDRTEVVLVFKAKGLDSSVCKI